MSTIYSVYKVVFHAELNGKFLATYGQRQAHVGVSNGAKDAVTLAAVLNNNGHTAPGSAVLVIDSCANAAGVGAFVNG